MSKKRKMSEIFHSLREEENRLGPSQLDPLGPFKSKMYFDDFLSLIRFLAYTLFFMTDIRILPVAGATWAISRPQGSASKVADEYLNGFCELAGAELKFSEIETHDRFAPARFLSKLFNLSKFCSKRKDLHFRERVLFGAANARFFDDGAELEEAISKLKVGGLITFCDQIGSENHLAQIAHSLGLKTITLQHGQYRLLDNAAMSQDIEAIYNFVSDRMLCWGEATVMQFEKIGISRNRFLSVGVLRQGFEATRALKCKWKRRDVKTNAFGLVLSGDNNKLNNDELISFAINLQVNSGMTCILRLHPRSSVALYPGLSRLQYEQVQDVDIFFQKIDFALMSSTGFFLECFYRRCAFIFLDSKFLPAPFRLSEVVASDINQVQDLAKAYVWDMLEKAVPYYFDDISQRERKICEVLNG